MTLRRALVVGAAWIVNHADVGHATLGFRALLSLLTHARGIQAHVRARAATRVALPLPRLLLAKRHFLLEQLGQSVPGRFGDALDGRFAQLQSTQLLQSHLGRLREAGLHARDTDHFAGRRREVRRAQTQPAIAREASLMTTATMIIVPPKAERPQQTVNPFATHRHTTGIGPTMRAD
jgi:hypothetical protein